MSLFKEHRLLHITITSLNAGRAAAGAAPITQTSMDARSVDSRVLPGATAGPSGQPQTQGQLLAASNGGAGPQGSPPPTQQRTNPFGNRVTPGGIAANAAANNGASMSSAATLGQGINAATQGVPPSTQQQQEQTDLLSGAASQKTTGSATTGAPTADNPSAPPSAPGAPGSSTTAASQDLVLQQLEGMATTPEGKLALAQYKQNLIDTENARKTADAQYTQEKTNSDAAYADVSAKNKAQEDSLNKNATDVRGLIDTIKKQNQDALDTQQKAGSDQLAWQAAKDSRTLSKSEVQAHQSLVAQIALEGGFGQDAAMVQVATSDANFESKIQDVQSKLGVDQTNLAAKYSALYVKNNNDYLTKSIANANDLQSTLMTVSQNENTAELGQTSANNGFLKDWYAEQNSITTKLASDNTTLVKDMQTALDGKAKADALLTAQKETNRIKEEAITATTANRQASLQAAATRAATAAGHTDTTAFDTQLANRGTYINQTRADMGDDKKSPAIVNYDTFNNTLGRFLPAAQQAVTDPSAISSTMIQDMVAQFGVVKTSSRVPLGVVSLINDNRSIISKLEGWGQQQAGKGNFPPELLASATKLAGDIQSGLQQAAQKEYSAYLVSNNSRNQLLIQHGLGDLIVNSSDLAHGDLGAPSPDTSNGQPNPSDIRSGKASASSAPSGSFSPSAVMKDGVSTTIGTRTVSGTPETISAVQQADNAFFAATGQHLQINSDYRSGAQQQQAYNDYLNGKIALASPPGTSLHEKGMAVDVTNWKEAGPYLVAAGLSPLGPVGSKVRSEDPAHFQLGSSSGGSNIASVDTSDSSVDTTGNDALLASIINDNPTDTSQ